MWFKHNKKLHLLFTILYEATLSNFRIIGNHKKDITVMGSLHIFKKKLVLLSYVNWTYSNYWNFGKPVNKFHKNPGISVG